MYKIQLGVMQGLDSACGVSMKGVHAAVVLNAGRLLEIGTAVWCYDFGDFVVRFVVLLLGYNLFGICCVLVQGSVLHDGRGCVGKQILTRY